MASANCWKCDSLVPIPANPLAAVTAVKAKSGDPELVEQVQ
jgi:hypothetical protein